MKRNNLSESKVAPYLYILPYTLVFLLFIAVPTINSFRMSFFDWNIVGNKEFIGFGNFKELFADKIFLKSVKNTIAYTLIYVPLYVAIGLLFAMFVNKKSVASTVVKTVMYIPYICMIPAIAIIWRWLLDSNFGVLNFYLEMIGIAPIKWLTDPNIVLKTLVMVILWQTSGYSMVVLLAGLQEVPKELYESATVDGAGPLRKFWNITVPFLQPSFFFLLIMGVIGGLKTFGQPYMLTLGGPGDASKTIVMYLYYQGFHYFRMGYAAAASVVLFLFILVVTIVNFKSIKQRYT